jgi:hypothetical protein
MKRPGRPDAVETKGWGLPHILGALASVLLAGGARGQEPEASPRSAAPPRTLERTREWKEGIEIRLRVPLATETHEVMCAVSFPESAIRSAVTGWGESTLTAIQKGSFLFLRLSKRAEGQLNVIGESGIHYLLYLEAVDATAPGGYDSFVKIVRPSPAAEGEALRKLAKGERAKPKGALDLIRSMRLGDRREGIRILRAKRELIYSSPDVDLRLLFVYQTSSYVGRVYEVRNLSGRKLAIDASRFRVAGDDLILSGLRENVIPPGGVSRLYTVFWRP